MKTFDLLCLALAGAALFSCGGTGKKNSGGTQGEISLSGAFALYPLAVQWAQDFHKLHPGVKVDVSAGGAGKGMTDCLAGVVDLGMLSRDVDSSEIARGAFPVAVARDAVGPVVNTHNPNIKDILARGLKRSWAMQLWIDGRELTWGQVLGTASTDPVHVYTRSDACGAAETFAQWLGKNQDDLKGTAVYADPGIAQAIQKDPFAIGMVNIAFAFDTKTMLPIADTHYIPIDINEDGVISEEENFYDTKQLFTAAISDGRYPTPPARSLWLVMKGKPTGIVKTFIEYILGEGQKTNPSLGYISLDEELLKEQREKIK